MTEKAAAASGAMLAPPPKQPPVTLAPDFCARLHGKSIRQCACRLPNEGGWALCPPEARGLLKPIDPRRLVVSAPSVFRVGPAHTSLSEAKVPAHLTGSTPVNRPAQQMPSPTGEFCECGGVMTRSGTCLTCQDCGSSSGGCS